MIGHLRGRLVDKRPNQVLVDVGGVGYQVYIPLSTFYALGELRDEITLLISASGVGPGLALKILSGMSVDELVPAIRRSDLVMLTRIPGVGKKTAERIVVELRDKLAAMETPEPARQETSGRTGLEADVVSALLNLGYDRRAAEKAVEEAQRNGGSASFEALLRATLQQLSGATQKGARASGAGG